jgi:hypothetical protein
MVNKYISSMNFNNYKNNVINLINSNGINRYSNMDTPYGFDMTIFGKYSGSQESFIGWNSAGNSNGTIFGKSYSELFGWKKMVGQHLQIQLQLQQILPIMRI